MTADQKLERLRETITEMGGMLLAYSGGVDSTFLMRVAHDVLGDRMLATTIHAEIHSKEEIDRAREVARQVGARTREVEARALDIEGFAHNPPDRCYICKKVLFTMLAGIAEEEGLPYVADGSNVDDGGDYRPGHKALHELSVRSPLKEAGLRKAEIRELSRRYELPTWDLPSAACLASRFPYHTEITDEALVQVDGAESFLRGLGFKVVRVRHHGGGLARIEVGEDDVERLASDATRDRVLEGLRGMGYTYVALDLQGYRTGSLNEVLAASAATPTEEEN